MSRSASAAFPARRILFSRIALLALVAGALGACNVVTLTEPIFTGSTPNQQAIISGQAAQYPGQQTASNAGAVPAGAVARQELPPAGRGVPAAPVVASQQPGTQAPASTRNYEPYAAKGMPKPVGRLAATPTMPQQPDSGPASAGGRYVVRAEDTLWSIAQAHGITTSDLLAANGLQSPSIAPGQTLVIPGAPGSNSMQVTSLNPGGAGAVPDIPAAMPERRPAEAAAPQRQLEQPPQAPRQTEPVAYAPASQPAESSAAAATNEAGSIGGFRWPVRGRVIAGFGNKANGERNDGIKLAVPEGTSVKAAEDGTVIYAGDELKSYGNLILIRHADGWVSAYAHNKELLVRRGDQVRRGQIVARSGMTGNVTTPQVHFELRKGATPVDPVPHMSDA